MPDARASPPTRRLLLARWTLFRPCNRESSYLTMRGAHHPRRRQLRQRRPLRPVDEAAGACRADCACACMHACAGAMCVVLTPVSVRTHSLKLSPPAARVDVNEFVTSTAIVSVAGASDHMPSRCAWQRAVTTAHALTSCLLWQGLCASQHSPPSVGKLPGPRRAAHGRLATLSL